MKRLLIFLLLSFYCISNSYGQLSLPSIDYDQVKKSKSKTSKKIAYFKAGKFLVEVYYPDEKGEIENLTCRQSNTLCDSIYYYHVPNLMKYTFSKETGNDVVKWKGNLKEYYGYYPSGNLRAHTKSIIKPDYFSDAPIQCGSIDFYIDEYSVYNKTGDTIEYYDYSNGIYKNQPSFLSSINISAFKAKADQQLISNMGAEFYTKYVRINYGLIRIDWDMEKIQRMNPRLPKGVLPPDSMILNVSFGYVIYINESEQYDLIHIQFDGEGNIVTLTEDQRKSMTNGLIYTAIDTLLTEKEVLIIAEPIIKNNVDVYVNVIWKDDDVMDGQGMYYYQILFNKTINLTANSITVTYDELLINAATKELSNVQKYSNKQEAIGEVSEEEISK